MNYKQGQLVSIWFAGSEEPETCLLVKEYHVKFDNSCSWDVIDSNGNTRPVNVTYIFELGSNDCVQLPSFRFPNIKRAMPNLIKNDILAIQSMSRPASKIFSFDYKHGKDDSVVEE